MHKYLINYNQGHSSRSNIGVKVKGKCQALPSATLKEKSGAEMAPGWSRFHVHRITGLHTQKAYTHTGTSSPQIIRDRS